MKPKLYFHAGYWRVSLSPKPYLKYLELWRKAHDHAGKLNNTDDACKYRQAVSDAHTARWKAKREDDKAKGLY